MYTHNTNTKLEQKSLIPVQSVALNYLNTKFGKLNCKDLNFIAKCCIDGLGKKMRDQIDNHELIIPYTIQLKRYQKRNKKLLLEWFQNNFDTILPELECIVLEDVDHNLYGTLNKELPTLLNN